MKMNYVLPVTALNIPFDAVVKVGFLNVSKHIDPLRQFANKCLKRSFAYMPPKYYRTYSKKALLCIFFFIHVRKRNPKDSIQKEGKGTEFCRITLPQNFLNANIPKKRVRVNSERLINDSKNIHHQGRPGALVTAPKIPRDHLSAYDFLHVLGFVVVA